MVTIYKRKQAAKLGNYAQKSQNFEKKICGTKTKKPILSTKFAPKITLYLIKKKVWHVFTENKRKADRNNIKKTGLKSHRIFFKTNTFNDIKDII